MHAEWERGEFLDDLCGDVLTEAFNHHASSIASTSAFGGFPSLKAHARAVAYPLRGVIRESRVQPEDKTAHRGSECGNGGMTRLVRGDWDDGERLRTLMSSGVRIDRRLTKYFLVGSYHSSAPFCHLFARPHSSPG